MWSIMCISWTFIFTKKCSAQNYLGSYVYSASDSSFTINRDSCYQIKSIPRVVNDTLVVVHWPPNSYFPKTYVFAIHRYNRHDVELYSSRHFSRFDTQAHYFKASLGKEPYEIKIIAYWKYTTIWITPIRFHRKHTIKNARGFCISNDYELIKRTFPLCKL